MQTMYVSHSFQNLHVFAGRFWKIHEASRAFAPCSDKSVVWYDMMIWRLCCLWNYKWNLIESNQGLMKASWHCLPAPSPTSCSQCNGQSERNETPTRYSTSLGWFDLILMWLMWLQFPLNACQKNWLLGKHSTPKSFSSSVRDDGWRYHNWIVPLFRIMMKPSYRLHWLLKKSLQYNIYVQSNWTTIYGKTKQDLTWLLTKIKVRVKEMHRLQGCQKTNPDPLYGKARHWLNWLDADLLSKISNRWTFSSLSHNKAAIQETCMVQVAKFLLHPRAESSCLKVAFTELPKKQAQALFRHIEQDPFANEDLEQSHPTPAAVWSYKVLPEREHRLKYSLRVQWQCMVYL